MLDFNHKLKRAPTRRSPELSALVLLALRSYANGDKPVTVDLATGTVSGDANGKLGDTFTFTGDAAHHGKVKLFVTVE